MRRTLLILTVACALASCSTSKTLYSWYDYEDVSYKYSKLGTEKAQNAMIIEYEKLINKQKGSRNVVPPGLLAEYGFILCSMDREEEGLKYLKSEITLYPESEIYISRIIKQLQK